MADRNTPLKGKPPSLFLSKFKPRGIADESRLRPQSPKWSPISAKWPWSRGSPTIVDSTSALPVLNNRTPALDSTSGSSKHTPKHSNDSGRVGITGTETIPMSDIDLTIAVDCSGSTAGPVLDEEKAAVCRVAGLLSKEAQARMMILPWTDETDAALSLDEIDDMCSGGGTDPTALLRDRHYRQALRNSSLWVLITDGEIKEDLVQDFSKDLGEAGLHGIASIVICVGRACGRPIGCNISVGKSVFATVPDCLFLFHDWREKSVYILQCKGRFRSLLPDPDCSIVLDEVTQWQDLPKVEYEALRDFAVPRKRTLDSNTVVLTSGNTFSLGDVYNDTLDLLLTNEILSNDDDLKTLLMTASTRGRKDDVKHWISKKQLRASDPLWAPRNDIESRGIKCIERLVYAYKKDRLGDTTNLGFELCSAHERNWISFITTIFDEEQNAQIRSDVIRDATARLALDQCDPVSPVQLSPVSPSLSGPRYNGTPRSDVSKTTDPQYTNVQLLRPSRAKTSSQRKTPYPGVLFTQGYRCIINLDSSKKSPTEHFSGICSLCRRTDQVMALILRVPEEQEPTPHYPAPSKHAKHAFPFVLGNFPEVDIVSNELCCEACSVFLKLHGQSPKVDRVVGALPLVQTHGKAHRNNLQAWTDTLNSCLEGRFHEDIILSVFLAVLYNTLDDLTSVDLAENTYLVRAVRWACKNLRQSILVSQDTTTIPLGQSPDPSSRSAAPFVEAIPRLFKDALNWRGPLLKYPLDGFLVLILAARDMAADNENCERGTLRSVLWLRLVTHIVEQHWLEITSAGHEHAKTLVDQLLQQEGKDNVPALTKRFSVSVESLSDSHLLSASDLQTLGRLGSLFTHIGSKCGPALAVLLHCLRAYTTKCKNPDECITLLRKKNKLRQLFATPELIDTARAADLIANSDS